MNKYVIIGSSAAGVGAAGKLRELDQHSSITMLTAESVPPYNRCLLADVLSGKKTAASIGLKAAVSFVDKNIHLQLNSFVESIDTKNQRVTVAGGQAVPYDKLLIATGRSGWMPDIPGNHLPGVMIFYGLTDTENILAYIKQHTPKNVAVIGAGLTGLECADAIKSYVQQVKIIERAARVLPHQLNSQGSIFFIEHAQKHGVVTELETTVAAIEGRKKVEQVHLSTGTVLPADMVIFAIGGRTNSHLAADAGIALHDNAIDVNNYQQTSCENVYAAGDVATVFDQVSGSKIQNGLWPDAVMQGMVAANNMTGNEKRYAGTVLVTSSTTFGLTFVTAGAIAHPPAGLKLLVKQTPDFYHAFLTDIEHVLKGFALIGNVDNIGALRKKLLDKTPLF
ncbi:NAD(P)/FAD-dependent oxidoreductase [Candidatus Dependentiae bacterium]|nr:NAD(P)/FAD-dependent oxidoreductase [Candidatus Dependentiae bacterium]